MGKSKLRPLGQIMLELEPYLEELIDSHDLQKSDVLALVDWWVNVHRPSCIEQYIDGSSPVLYTHKNVILKLRKKGKLK